MNILTLNLNILPSTSEKKMFASLLDDDPATEDKM